MSVAALAAAIAGVAGFAHVPHVVVASAFAQSQATAGSWLRVEATRAQLAGSLGRDAGAIDYGRFQWVSAASVDAVALRAAGFAVTDVVDPFVLDLGGLRFDPIQSAPASTRDASGGHDWQIVQFDGPAKPEWLDGLRGAGLEVAQYVHPYAYVVWGDATQRAAASAGAHVRWAGAFAAEFRLHPDQRALGPAVRQTMALVSRHADAAVWQADLAARGGTLKSATPLDTHFVVVEFDAPGSAYADIAAIPGVYTVQAVPTDGGPRGEMNGQSIVGGYGAGPAYTVVPGYPAWLAALGYNGAGVIAAVVDGGVRTTHQDLASQMSPCVSAGGTPTTCTTSNDSHGTHVASAIAGIGTPTALLNGFIRGQGIAPGAKVVQQRYNAFLGGGSGGMITNGMLTIYKESSLSSAVLTNNSWGPGGSPVGYNIPTQQVDIVARDANPDVPGNQQILNVWSVMNGNGDGSGACAPSALGSPDEAKNLFAVGSTKMQNNSGAQLSSIFDISSNSAHGNACDGRRRPDIVAPGCSTDSATGTSNTSYGFMCGTSMASPVVTGAASVFIEKYRAEHAGATPSPALVKAAFTAVATNLEGFRDADNRVMGHRPDRFQGYGRIDLDATVNAAEPMFSIDQSELFTTTGQAWTRSLTAADPTRPIRVMLAWTDAKGHGLGGTTPAWVNNLDLAVTTSSGTFLGNVVGTDGWSATGGTADDKNNLEGVFLSPAQHGGSVQITVTAANIAGDALNPYTPGTPAQDFALVCYNCQEQAILGTADLGLSLAASPSTVTVGDTLTFTASIVNFGPDDASGVRFTLDLPEGLAYASSRVVQGATAWACQAVAREVTCDLTGGALASGEFATVLQVATTVESGAGASLVATGNVSATQFTDTRPSNNTVVTPVRIGDDLFADGFDP